MADIYDRAKASASRMLGLRSNGGKGATLTLIKVTEGDYDPATSNSTDIETSYVGSGVRDNYDIGEVDGTLVQQSDFKLLVSPILQNGNDIPAPEPQDKITFDGEIVRVISVLPWNFAGFSIGYEVQVRK